jgi:GNAT superfamily N-acetyltransferase
MPPEIRTATILDAEAVCAVVRRSITECCKADHKGEPKSIAAWLENKTTENAVLWIQEPGAISLVGVVNEKVVGFALSRNGELALCYVVPDVLHKGVGKSLLYAIESRSAMQGVSTLRLDSTQTAKNFYLRNGYIATGPAVSWAGLECQPMSKLLEQYQTLI